MANDKLLLGWQDQCTDVKADSENANYPATNVLDDDLSTVFRSASVAVPVNIDVLLGTLYFSASTGQPTSGPPTQIPYRMVMHPDGTYVACVFAASPYLAVYAYDSNTGTFGGKVADPADPVTAAPTNVKWAPNGNWLLLSHPSISKWADIGFSVWAFNKTTGAFGARSANPGTFRAFRSAGGCFTTDGDYILLCLDNSNGTDNLEGYRGHPFDKTTGVISNIDSNYKSGATTGASGAQDVESVNVSGLRYFFVTSSVSPYLYACKYTPAAAWGTIKNPSVALTATCNGIALSAAATTIYAVTGNAVSPFIHGYPFTDASGFGTKIANPATLPDAEVKDVAFGRVDAAIAVAEDHATQVFVYGFAAGAYGTRYAPFKTVTPKGRSCVWSANSSFVIVGEDAANWIDSYPFSLAPLNGTVDAVLIARTNLDIDATVQIKLGTTVGGSQVYDSGAIAPFPASVDANILAVYGRDVKHVLPAMKTAQYMRVTLSQVSNLDGYLQAGLIKALPGFQPTRDEAIGSEAGILDLTRETETQAGRVLFDERPRKRQWAFTLNGLTDDEIVGTIHPLIMGGRSAKYLVLPFPNDAEKAYYLGLYGHLRVTSQVKLPIVGKTRYWSVAMQAEEAI